MSPNIQLQAFEDVNPFCWQLLAFLCILKIGSVNRRDLKRTFLTRLQNQNQLLPMNLFIDIEYPESLQNGPSSLLPPALKDYQQGPILNKIIARDLKTTNTDLGFHWSPIEQKRYVQFLLEHRADFDLPLLEKRKKRLHVLMAKSIKMRDSSQCRSHHQKMMKRFKSIEAIIQEHSYLFHSLRVESPQQAEVMHQEKQMKQSGFKKEEDRPQMLALDQICKLDRPSTISHLQALQLLDEEDYDIEAHQPDLLSILAAQ